MKTFQRIFLFWATLILIGLSPSFAQAASSSAAVSPDASGTGKDPAIRASVDSLLGWHYRSLRVMGNPKVKNRQLRIDFFMHSTSPGEPERPTMVFRAGCNSNGAKFRIGNGRLRAYGGFTGTDVGCLVDPDRWISGNLRKGMEVRISGDRLTLARPGARVRFLLERTGPTRFTRRDEGTPTPTQPSMPDLQGEPVTMEWLDGKSFRSTETFGTPLTKPVEIGFFTGPTLRRDEEGRQITGPIMGAYLGCNWMGGEYTVTDGDLNWFDVIQTLMGCEYDKDSWFHEFANEAGAEVVDGQLVMSTEDQMIIFGQTQG